MISRATVSSAHGWMLLAFGALACQPMDLDRLAPLERPSAPAQLRGGEFEGYRGENRDVRVRAVRAEVDVSERVADLQTVEIEFQDAERGRVQVEAAGARLHLVSDDFVLSGGVRGTTAEGDRFETAEVRYERARERLWSESPVKILGENLDVSGQGMEIDLVGNTIRLHGGVRARVQRP